MRSGFVIGILALGATACGGYDCEEGCKRDPPICEDSSGVLSCESACEGYAEESGCTDEGEKVVRCFERNPGACGGELPEESDPCLSYREEFSRCTEREGATG